MAQQVTMPQLGLTMNEGTVYEWVLGEGDEVSKGDILLVVENDKSTVDVESQYDGVLGKILVEEGETVPVGSPIAWIVAEGEAVPEESSEEGTDTAQPVPASPPPDTTEARDSQKSAAGDEAAGGRRAAPAASDGFIPASPRARSLAQERGIDLAGLTGSGPEGSIVERDISAAADAQEAARGGAEGAVQQLPAQAHEVSLSRIQAIGARRMSESWTEIPQFTLERAARADAVLQLKEHFKKEKELPVSLNIILAKIMAHAVAAHPRLNARWLGEEKIKLFPQVDVGIAMDSPQGLTVPVLRNATGKGFTTLAEEWSRIAPAVREGRADPDLLTGATVTLSNLGMFGITRFRAIVNPPQAAIVSVGAVDTRAAEGSNGLILERVLNLCVTADHRIADGAYAARFMQHFAQMVENPVLIYE
jgi:pyruvate dehydrogenase E2 component (dihydrolipoamide acetyltransferase)